MMQRHKSPEDILKQFLEGQLEVTKLMVEIDERIEKTGEDDRTKAHRYTKVIQRYFFTNGGM